LRSLSFDASPAARDDVGLSEAALALWIVLGIFGGIALLGGVVAGIILLVTRK
jgi:hypothetical protein